MRPSYPGISRPDKIRIGMASTVLASLPACEIGQPLKGAVTVFLKMLATICPQNG
jgi:hypothetical protein